MTTELLASMSRYAKAYREDADVEGIRSEGKALASQIKASGVAAYSSSAVDRPDYLEQITKISAYKYGNPECTAAAKEVVAKIMERDPDLGDLVDIYVGQQAVLDLFKVDPEVMSAYKRNGEKLVRLSKLGERLQNFIERTNNTRNGIDACVGDRKLRALSIKEDFEIARTVFNTHELSKDEKLIFESLENLSNSLSRGPESIARLELPSLPNRDEKQISGTRFPEETLEDFANRQYENVIFFEALTSVLEEGEATLSKQIEKLSTAIGVIEKAKDNEARLERDALKAAKEVLATTPKLSNDMRVVLNAMPAIVNGYGRLNLRLETLSRA